MSPVPETRMSTIHEPASPEREAEGSPSTHERTREGLRAVGDQAREGATAYTESQKRQVSESIDQFAKAIERAGDELQQRDQSLAGQLVRDAAGSLSELSRSIGGSSTSAIVDSVRDFGRRNPAAFIGGAVLAGLALGRFARSAPRPESAAQPSARGYASNAEDPHTAPSYPSVGSASDGGTP
jgi:hypothetical protein